MVGACQHTKSTSRAREHSRYGQPHHAINTQQAYEKTDPQRKQRSTAIQDTLCTESSPPLSYKVTADSVELSGGLLSVHLPSSNSANRCTHLKFEVS